jgi:hypothetical protein
MQILVETAEQAVKSSAHLVELNKKCVMAMWRIDFDVVACAAS